MGIPFHWKNISAQLKLTSPIYYSSHSPFSKPSRSSETPRLASTLLNMQWSIIFTTTPDSQLHAPSNTHRKPHFQFIQDLFPVPPATTSNWICGASAYASVATVRSSKSRLEIDEYMVRAIYTGHVQQRSSPRQWPLTVKDQACSKSKKECGTRRLAEF